MAAEPIKLKISREELYSKEALLALYHETCAEIARLRQTEWRIGYYFLTLSIALIALTLNESFLIFLEKWLRFVLTVVQVISCIFGLYWLYTTHKFLTEQRNLRRKIENLLGFQEPRVYTPKGVLPEAWKEPITNRFQWGSTVLPIAVAVVLVQLFSMFVLWKVGGPDAVSLPADSRAPTSCWTEGETQPGTSMLATRLRKPGPVVPTYNIAAATNEGSAISIANNPTIWRPLEACTPD